MEKKHPTFPLLVLSRQTFSQFRSYAEQQYPDNPDQQAVLIRQLQEQHYYQYMQQIYQQQVRERTDPFTVMNFYIT